MKKYQISPGQIPHLVRLTADLFNTMNKEVAYSPNKGEKATQMHFVVDLLKDLVDTAYPVANGGVISKETLGEIGGFQGQEIHVIQMGESTSFTNESLDKAMENIAKIMKSYKPPKAGEF
ncbi:hypothetical protein [Tissierella sp.]|uniref:hypothetical protein n=1 Tax=Tissierella sp. TaxID=41274 RepID=UPI0028569670|nr:hypothetical protein [Tissierella sp.]MDR7856023.1 hypothetical protein [Tissierella sp.]